MAERTISRRDFLKLGGMVATGFALEACGLFDRFHPDTLTPEKLEIYRGDLQFVRNELKRVSREIVKPLITQIKPTGALFIGDSMYIGWDVLPNKQTVNLYTFNILGDGNLPYSYNVRISREVPEAGSVTLSTVGAHEGFSLVSGAQPTQRILHASYKDPLRFPETPWDDKLLRLGQPIYRGVTMDLNYPDIPRLSLDRAEVALLRSELGIDPEQYTKLASKRRYDMLNGAKGVIEEAVNLPEITRWFPELEYDGWQAFGRLPNGDRLYIIFKAQDAREKDYRGTRASLFIVDATSGFLPDGVLGMTFEEAAKKQIERMREGNVERQKRGWTPHPATEDLNKIRQELGF